MLTLDEIRKIDLNNMHMAYENWPDIAKSNFNKNFDKIELQNGTIYDIINILLYFIIL